MRHVIDDMLHEDPYEPFLRDDYEPLYRTRLSMGRPRSTHRADNDNNPDRITRMVPYNGGCSTTSGRTPVTMPRLDCLGEGLEGVIAPATQVAA